MYSTGRIIPDAILKDGANEKNLPLMAWIRMYYDLNVDTRHPHCIVGLDKNGDDPCGRIFEHATKELYDQKEIWIVDSDEVSPDWDTEFRLHPAVGVSRFALHIWEYRLKQWDQ